MLYYAMLYYNMEGLSCLRLWNHRLLSCDLQTVPCKSVSEPLNLTNI